LLSVPARPSHSIKSLEVFLQSGDKRANPRMANATASLHTRAFRKNKFNSRFEDQSDEKPLT
jgi:hypothetical protein